MGKLLLFIIFTASLLFAVISSSFGQKQISFRQLSVKDGLSQNSAISVVQDSIGYLWIATQDGLNRYDGKKFTHYPLSFTDITKPDYSYLGKVYTDRQGQVWAIPSDNQLYKLDKKKDLFEPVSGLVDVSILFQDSQLNFWIGTYSTGLILMDPINYTTQEVINSDQMGSVYAIDQSRNRILVATDYGIVEIEKETKKVFPVSGQTFEGTIIKEKFSSIAVDETGRQWYGTFGGGLFFRESDQNFLNSSAELNVTEPLPSDLNILSLFVDSKDRLWIGTYGRGVYMINRERNDIQNFTTEKNNPKAIYYNDILSIYEDYTGTLWFGTDGAGLCYYDEYLEKFNAITNAQIPENINVDVVRAIAVDSMGTTWIGTSGKGLTQYQPSTNSWRTYKQTNTTASTLPSDRIMSLLPDNAGKLWIGTQGGGLSIYHDGKFTNFLEDSTLQAATIWDIYKDGEERYWLGTRENGLIQFDPEKGIVNKFVSDQRQGKWLQNNNIRVITEDHQRNLWLGTDSDGIVYFDIRKNEFITYQHSSENNSLSSNEIKCLYYAPDSILWIGTNGGGLNAFDTNRKIFYRYTKENGLPNNVIYAILPDSEGNMWLSSNKGLTRFTPGNELDDLPDIVNYNHYDGLAAEFNTGAYYAARNGNLYFGGLEGFYWFKPEEIQENLVLPKTTITRISVLDKPVHISSGTRLPYKQNTISFEFSSLQFSLPEGNNYRYRLFDYESEWVDAGNNNYVRYTRLPPGDYQFEVKSSNYDGVWNDNPEVFNFSIAPLWYLTIYAKCFYLFLVLLAVWGIYTYLKWRLRMQLNFQLKNKEAERFKKLNALKSKLYTDISHEFRTPLTLISGPIDAKLSQGGLTESDFAAYSMINRNINRLLNLVDQLLHLAKLEKGKLKRKISRANLEYFLAAMVSSFRYKASEKNIDYQISIDSLNETWYDEDIVEKIVTNLLSNAFKYCPNNGTCTFEATRRETNIQINIRNSIEELSDIHPEKFFTRFYQKDEYAEGAGVGLSLVKELVRLYNGRISAQIEQDNVIHFQVTLPVARSCFNQNEVIQRASKDNELGQVQTAMAKTPGADRNKNSNNLPILLLVEDHKEVRDFLKAVWENKYHIYEAGNGEEGMETALETIPDLIISDVRMPVCDGIELCNRLKTDERTSHIPVILLTAGIGEENELKGLQSGADDFVTKPFKLRILEKRVENQIEIRQALRRHYSKEFILKPKDIAVTPTDELFLQRVQDTLDKHLSDPEFGAKMFCREIGMSRMQLHRKLQAYTGLSTTAFIRSQRLKQALQILKTSDVSINEVAYSVGFNSPSYFIKCFRETYKKTPSEYV